MVNMTIWVQLDIDSLQEPNAVKIEKDFSCIDSAISTLVEFAKGKKIYEIHIYGGK